MLLCNGRSRNFHIPEKWEIANFNSYQIIQDFWLLNGTIYHIIVYGTVMKIYNNTYMIASTSTQTRDTEIFALIAILVFQLLSRKVWFINKKYHSNC